MDRRSQQGQGTGGGMGSFGQIVGWLICDFGVEHFQLMTKGKEWGSHRRAEKELERKDSSWGGGKHAWDRMRKARDVKEQNDKRDFTNVKFQLIQRQHK